MREELPDLIRKHAVRHVCSYWPDTEKLGVILRLYVSVTEPCLYYTSEWRMTPYGLERDNNVLSVASSGRIAQILKGYRDTVRRMKYAEGPMILERCKMRLMMPGSEEWADYWTLCVKTAEFMMKDRRYDR